MSFPADPSLQMTDPTELGWRLDVFVEADRILVTEQPGTYCLLIYQHGRIVFERYYHDFEPETRFDVCSVTKSALSMLVGIAMSDGVLSLDSTLGKLIPELLPREELGRVGAITVEQLLSMTAGFAWDDLEDFLRLQESDDWVATVLQTPLATAPGEHFNYNSGCSQLLSATLTRTMGQPVLDIALERLFRPMGITPGAWPTDPQGFNTGGFGLQLRARDMLKLGMLVLQHGVWQGVQLVPGNYLRVATSHQSGGGFPEGTPYGHHWWTSHIGGWNVTFAAGYGGQYICVVPGLDLVVVTTAFWQGPPNELSHPNVAIRHVIRGLAAHS